MTDFIKSKGSLINAEISENIIKNADSILNVQNDIQNLKMTKNIFTNKDNKKSYIRKIIIGIIISTSSGILVYLITTYLIK